MEKSFAISVRIEHRSMGRAKAARYHDLRLGHVPGYVDQERMPENSIILEPAQPAALRQVCLANRANRPTQRAMRKDAAIASCFIITFGKAAQPIFEALPPSRQDAAYKAVADAVATLLGSEVTGLVAHRDETAPHAHGQMPAFRSDGRPLSKVLTPSMAKQVQDVAAQAIAEFAPQIVRGKPKAQRIADGEPRSKTVHRSVQQLHSDLPQEISEKAAEIEKLQGRIAKMRAKEKLTAANVRTLATYERRLKERLAQMEEKQRALANHARALQEQQAEQAARETALAEREAAVTIREQEASAQIAGLQAAVEAVRDGTVTRGGDGRPKVTDAAHAALLRPVWRSLGPLVMALADMRAEMASSLQRFRDLFRRNELHNDIAEEGKDYLGGIEP
jgi:PAS domain-containing protein